MVLIYVGIKHYRNVFLCNAEKWKRQLNSVIVAVIKHCFPACEDFGLLVFQVLDLLKVVNHALFVKQWKAGSKVLFCK